VGIVNVTSRYAWTPFGYVLHSPAIASSRACRAPNWGKTDCDDAGHYYVRSRSLGRDLKRTKKAFDALRDEWEPDLGFLQERSPQNLGTVNRDRNTPERPETAWLRQLRSAHFEHHSFRRV
jgi:hypothetical protein